MISPKEHHQLVQRTAAALKKLLPKGWAGVVTIGIPIDGESGELQGVWCWRGVASPDAAALLLEVTAKAIRSKTQ